MMSSPIDLLTVLGEYQPRSEEEAADVERLRQIAAGDADPWARSTPIHATGSAIIVHPPTRRVLLRWHERMQAWLQVGGHADPGETDAFDIALREAREETGLPDLSAWPDPERPTLVQVTIVPVPAGKGEPAHHHADLRYMLSTERPDEVTPESDKAQLRWLEVKDALQEITEENLRVCLLRVAEALRLVATRCSRA
jgi:8-oxo-dGTP pyrophosphatase MutT (NUDIX family)